MQLNKNLPIYSFMLDTHYNKKKIYDEIINDSNSKEAKDYLAIGNNFKLDNKYNFLDKIYECLLQECTKLFGPIQLDTANIKNGWAYINNKNFYKNGIHNHLNTSTINSVYYLNVPDTKTGAIKFFDYKENVIYTHHPKEKELIIFPNYMLHEPCQSMTDEYRIAINLEIKCQNVWGI